MTANYINIMSLVKKILSTIFSFLFLIFLFLSINSYTIGNLIKKENIRNFAKYELGPEIIKNECEKYCSEIELKKVCMEKCFSKLSNKTDEMINSYLNEYYKKKLFGFSLDEFSNFFSNSTLFIFLTIIFLIPLFFVSKNPIKVVGLNLLNTGISILVTSLLATFSLTKFISLPTEVKPILDYIVSGLKNNIYISIFLLIMGIILILISYKLTSLSRHTSQEK